VTPDEAVVSLVGAVDAAGVPYMIVGSLASNLHGIPRSTRDTDFVLHSRDSLQRSAGCLPREGLGS